MGLGHPLRFSAAGYKSGRDWISNLAVSTQGMIITVSMARHGLTRSKRAIPDMGRRIVESGWKEDIAR